MRSLLVTLFALSALCASAQDASQMAAQQAMQANQQAMQAAQQATQQAAEAAQQATQQAMQANQQAMQAAQQANNYCCGSYSYAAAPRFSKKTGSYRPGTTVRLKDSTRGAVMYYTTDGWTPTSQSHRYVGPIKLDSSTVLQAIAIAPGHLQSSVAVATYTIPGAPAAALPSTNIAYLSPGTPLPFVFTSDVTSKGLEIGDRLPVALAEDLVVGGKLVAPRLTPVRVTVMQVDGPGAGGAPGTITFAVHSITLANGETIPLSGTETTDGHSRTIASQSIAIIPWVGLAGLFIHGKQAVIPKGAIFTGYIESGDATLSADLASPDVQP